MALLHSYFFSNVLGRNVNCEVVIPDNFDKERRGPVLWLLHGSGDDHTAWQRLTSIERYAERYGIAVVMPSADHSGYCNDAHGFRYFDYAAKELPETMHSFFGFSTAREDNFVCGLSMGGWGALKVGFALPERYAAVGVLSAGIFSYPIPEGTCHFDPVNDRSKYIHYENRELAGSEEDITGNAERILKDGRPAPGVFISIGDNDHCLEQARFTRDFLSAFDGDPFDLRYEEHPGSHNWEYWDEHIVDFLEYIKIK